MPIPPLPPGVFEIQSGPWRAWVIPFGARMMQLWYDKKPLLLGFQSPEAYRQDPSSMGAICGRYGNRIEDARLVRDGREWTLDANEGAQCLHGGSGGFGVSDWSVHSHSSEELVLLMDSPDLDQGWPGRCQARVTFRVEPSAVSCFISAQVDQPCPLNLIQHNYWNLGCDAANHRLHMPSDTTWDNDARNLPQQARGVTPAEDFQSVRPLGHAQFDQTFEVAGQGMRLMAALHGPLGQLNVFADQPSIQLYTAAHLTPSAPALGTPHNPGSAVCLETQQLPNGPALGEPVWVVPNQRYTHQMRWEFNAA